MSLEVGTLPLMSSRRSYKTYEWQKKFLFAEKLKDETISL